MNSPILTQSDGSFDYKTWRESFIVTILRITCVLGVAIVAASFSTATNTDRILFTVMYIALLAITLTPIKYETRAVALLLMTFTLGVNATLSWGPWLDGNIFFIMFIVLSALLFDKRIDLIALAVSIFTFTLIAVLQQAGVFQLRAPTAPVPTISDWAPYAINFSIISGILMTAINHLKKEFARVAENMRHTFQTLANERGQLENRVRERTDELEARANQLHASASISRTIAELQDISELMEAATRLTSEKFGNYHTGLYLLDERKKNAFLQAASSANGKALIGQGFRIEPDRLNIIHSVIEHNRPHMASDVDNVEFIHDANFPLTRSRLILPLTVRNNVIGILDLHSDQPRVFSKQDAEVLQTLADLVAISIDNVRLIDETKSLVRQLEANASMQTKETWTKFTGRHKPAYQYTPAGVRPIFINNILKRNDEGGLKVALTLHGQDIGRITLKRKGATATWTERERILVKKVADQVALALENSRLVDETQKKAMRDQVIANVSAKIRETLNVESVLRTAAAEFRKVFDLKETEISIGISPAENTVARKKTNSLSQKID